ncbi:Protein DA1-like [Phytophthora cactorum]|nr:Protein DA1-like [Phytophthora cactorum]
MGWTCVQCTFLNANESAANCGACNAIRVLQCPTCKGEIKYGKRLHVNGKTYHPDCFCCTGCKRPLPSRFQVVNGGNYHPECAPTQKPVTKTTTTTRTSGGGGRPVQNEKYNSPVQNENCSRNANVKTNGNAESNGNGGAGTVPAAHGKAYHPDCFRCAACNGKFTTSKFQVKDGEYYHHECYKQLYHPRCDVCEGFIPYQPGTQKISFKVMPFGDLKYCAEHEHRDRCCSCQRVEAQGVVKEVWAYMRDIGIHLPEIPVYLVESPVLNEQCNAHKKTKTLMKDNKPVEGHVTRGLCLSEVSQIQHMVRTGKHAVPRVASIQKKRSVNAILILHGLPYDLTASVLAHEATHAYIKLSDNFPDHIPPKYKHMMERKESKKRTYEGRLRKFYMHQLKNDISPVYGDGFREAYEAYKRVNSLQRMFDAIRRHASFP